MRLIEKMKIAKAIKEASKSKYVNNIEMTTIFMSQEIFNHIMKNIGEKDFVKTLNNWNYKIVQVMCGNKYRVLEDRLEVVKI